MEIGRLQHPQHIILVQHLLQAPDAQVVDISLDNPQGVGVTHATLPALDNDDSVVAGQNTKIQRLGHTPLDTPVNILLPVDLGKIGLFLWEVERIHTAIQVSVSGGGSATGDHEDGADRAVLGQQAG